MHYAAGATYSDTILEVLANENADVNAKCREGKTPLHIAAIHGRCSRARVLLSHGKTVRLTPPGQVLGTASCLLGFSFDRC